MSRRRPSRMSTPARREPETSAQAPPATPPVQPPPVRPGQPRARDRAFPRRCGRWRRGECRGATRSLRSIGRRRVHAGTRRVRCVGRRREARPIRGSGHSRSARSRSGPFRPPCAGGGRYPSLGGERRSAPRRRSETRRTRCDAANKQRFVAAGESRAGEEAGAVDVGVDDDGPPIRVSGQRQLRTASRKASASSTLRSSITCSP